ncbi:LINE-1 retrotransposable element ORF1 protein [Nibea albiflora]|uniref:LINE-1 retrotransposable element ORF1 protein n=1 Tax=Nibea albiflora TaxID=240163 RepID=A0ACB7F3B8_NIBAL|nr:LINE-1 retrotransposable element ORF1 protein [Nibea albiflora]
MPNDTTKTSAGDRLARYHFRNKEGDEKSSETTDANKQATPDEASASKTTDTAVNGLEEMLQAIAQSNREIRGDIQQMSMDVKEFKGQSKESFTKLETSIGSLSAQITKLEKRVVDAEERVTATEEATAIHGKAIGFLLQREAELFERCEDLQNRHRRQNLRLYQVPEGSEGRDMVAFIKKLLPTVLTNLPLAEADIRIDRAHRALMPKPKENDLPRSIVIQFTDYTVKEQILQQAWRQRTVKMGEKQIYFDNDYSPELQRKRAQVRYVVKQLKEKNVKAKCMYPARLRMMVGSEEKTFQTVMDAAPVLKELNIQIRVDERDKVERELTRHRWETRAGNRRGRKVNMLTEEECRFFLP